MDSISEWYPKTLGDDDGYDRISNLPDSILSHILRFIPTKHAVATIILSTKWKIIFASIPNPHLEFDDSLTLHPEEEQAENSSHANNRTSSFIDFMNRVLNVILRDVPNIPRITLNCHRDYEDSQIIAWIGDVLRRNVPMLDFNVNMENPSLLFHTLSGCTALEHLDLCKLSHIDVPTSFCLPNLKSLDLDYVGFLNDTSISQLFTGCPVLESLSLTSCDLQRIDTLFICIPSLKGLIMEDCYGAIGFAIVFDTPALEVFMFNDRVADNYLVKNFKSLTKAHIDVGFNKEQLEDENRLDYEENVAELVAACSNVNALFLSKVSIAEFYDEEGSYAIFKSCLLENVPICLSLHLKKIELRSFCGEEDEIKLVEYFFKNAKVLNKIEITSYSPWEKVLRIWKRLLMFPKQSKACKIVFV